MFNLFMHLLSKFGWADGYEAIQCYENKIPNEIDKNKI